ncbi:hypothetical protein [Halorussus amylolyticus]|uniref:hypothetical protein n=1 Tax=Halorussus amylolyticus TaxID=1126242 RepID=UPI001052A7BE|nr:hypothetical protein [Halorussus amylolyticus]
MPSRRRVLSLLGSATAVGLAGCSGSDSGRSDTISCHTSAIEHGDGDFLDGGAMATVEDDDVRFAVPLSVDDVREQNVNALELYDAAGKLAHVIPVSAGDADVMANKDGVSDGKLRYEQYLGERPLHGRYRVVAVDESDETVDSITVEFNCFPDVRE